MQVIRTIQFKQNYDMKFKYFFQINLIRFNLNIFEYRETEFTRCQLLYIFNFKLYLFFS